MKPLLCLGVVLCLLVSLTAFSPSQPSPVSESVLTVSGEGIAPLKLRLSDLAKLPRQTVRVKDHEGQEAVYEGVLLTEILSRAGVKFGKDVHGKPLAQYILVEAMDGYQAIFARPEVDPAFTDKVVLLADRRDNQVLPAKEGPLRLIVPDEKRQARWVRQVKTLTIKQG